MERHQGERFNENPWEPYPPDYDDRNCDYHGGWGGGGWGGGGGGGGFPGNINNHNAQHHNHYKKHHNRRHDHQYDDGGYRGGGADEFHRHQHNGPPGGSFSNGESGHGHGFSNKPQIPRKRRFSTSDCPDGGNYAKLFVGGVPRTVTEEEIRRLFEEHGNVIEVVLVKDKRTFQQHEYCFVKYASMEEADTAIATLHNRYMFPGGVDPIRVKYADGERERLAVQHKVYVNGLNKQASKEEIAEIFSHYGVVEDVYIMLDDFKQSRGCGFVGFSNRDMALAAISGLNGTYVMRGCDRPLVVRFADPKKPRPAPDFREDHGSNVPSAAHMGNSCAPTCENAATVHLEAASQFTNHLQQPACGVIQQPLHQQPVSSSQASQMSSLRSPGMVSKSEMPYRASAESNVAVISWECASPEDYPECEWSEHVCPEGNKYYYNCITYWEKPEEFAQYQEQLHKQQEPQNLSVQENLPFLKSEVPSGKQNSHIRAMQHQSQSSQQETTEKPVSCALERSHEKVPADTSPVIAPEPVQQLRISRTLQL
ncbi:hypothetical protein Ancab_020362 [Ancistrocladus abbreviatus]